LQRTLNGPYQDPDSGARVWFQDFADGYPASQANLCLRTDPTKTSRWVDSDCNVTNTFTQVMCETDYWSYAWGSTIQVNGLDKNIQDTGPFPNTLPQSDATIVYGMTVYSPLTDCKPYDLYFVDGFVDNQIVLTQQTHCISMYAGRLSTSRYSAFLQKIKWYAVNSWRVSIDHSYIYWTTPAVRNIQVDSLQLAGTYFYVIESRVLATPDPSYPWYSAYEMCEHSGHQVAEMSTTQHWQVAKRSLMTSQLPMAFIAASRGGASGPFTWTYSTPATVPLIPGASASIDWDQGKQCLALAAAGPFLDVDCNTYLPGVVCRAAPLNSYFDPAPQVTNINTNSPISNIARCSTTYTNADCPTVEYSATGGSANDWRLSTNWYANYGNSWDNTFSNYPASSKWNTNGQAIVYGVSVQLAVSQCMPEWGDTLVVNGGVPSGCSSSYDYKTCTLHVYGNNTMNKYENNVVTNVKIQSNYGSPLIKSPSR